MEWGRNERGCIELVRTLCLMGDHACACIYLSLDVIARPTAHPCLSMWVYHIFTIHFKVVIATLRGCRRCCRSGS